MTMSTNHYLNYFKIITLKLINLLYMINYN